MLVSSGARFIVISRELVRLRWLHFAARPMLVALAAGSVLLPLREMVPGLASGLIYVVLCAAGVYWTAQLSLADIGEVLRRPAD